MKTVTKGGVTSVVAQNEVIIPDLTIKDLLSAIPSVAFPALHLRFVFIVALPCPDPTVSSVQHSAPRFTCKQVLRTSCT